MRAFVIVVAAAAGLSQNAISPGTQTIDVVFQGRVRQYALHVPLADREHFIVAYPEAFERSWADGRMVTIAEEQGIDDVGFAKAVVADIAKTYAVDRSRVFAAGLSNGGGGHRWPPFAHARR